MKSFKHLLLAKGVAAAIVGTTGIAAPAISHASPDDGMICRVGYAGALVNGNMKCTRHVQKIVPLACTNFQFPNRLIRTAGIPGDTTGGRDMCLRNGIVLGSNQPATGLVKGQDFVFVTVNQTAVNAAAHQAELDEEAHLGLGTDGVDAHSAGRVDVNGGIGAEDRVVADVTLFTFSVPAPTLFKLPTLINIPVIDLPLP